MLLPPTCLSFGLPVSPACLSVSQTSMDDSGHKGNIGLCAVSNNRVPINFCKVIHENFGQNWGKITQHLVSTRLKKDFKTVCNEPPLASVMMQI